MAISASSAGGKPRRPGGIRVTALQMGIVMAFAAVLAGSLFEVRPPDAYGICMACHARDLLDWSINRMAGTHLTIAPASLVFPVLTTIGVLVGAVLASSTSGEFRWSTPDNSLKTFVYGAAVMISALVAGGCSIRLLLRTSAGDLAGLTGFAGMAAGVALATLWLRWQASR
jgi:hypothetical protein